jgi:hypothetical protein
MSEPFLARWSRKKIEAEREADREAAPASEPAAAETSRDHESSAAPPAQAADAENDQASQVDLAALPPIESIGPATDIRAFLQAGVPSELTRAALRRVWTSDPTIRDFIGIAENQWDFASETGVPGFGPLKAIDEVRRLAAQVASEVERSAPAVDPAEPATASEQPLESIDSKSAEAGLDAKREDIAAISQDQRRQNEPPSPAAASIVQRNEADAAPQNENQKDEHSALPTRRVHGRALPE